MVILETPRLFLKQFRNEDVSSLHTIFSDPETMRFYPSPFRIQQTQDWIKRNQERYAHDGYVSIIDPKNIASIRVAEKMGFTFEKETFIFGKKHYIYSGFRD